MNRPPEESIRERLLARRSLWFGLAVLALATAYAVLFPWMTRHFGSLTRVFSLSFVLLAAWQWGLWGGVAVSTGNLGLNLFLHHGLVEPLVGGALGPIVGFALAVLVGRLSDVTRRLRGQLARQRRIEQELANHRDRLEDEVQARTRALTEANQRLEPEMAERRRAEATCRENEEKYRLVVENAGEAIVVVQEGRIKYFNRQAAQLAGYLGEELAARPFLDFIHPRDREMVADRYRRRLAGEEVPGVYTFQINSAEGEERWAEINVVSVTWEGRPATLSFLSDVSDRMETERALRESEARFRELAELMPQTVFEVDALGRLTFANQGAFTQFGYTPDDMARGLNAFDLVIGEDRDQAMANARRVMGGRDIGLNEYRFVRRDGSVFPAMLHTNPIEREGRVVGLRGFIIDITERKAIEVALRESEARYRLLVDNAPAGIYEIDFTTGKFLSVNDVMIEYTGFSREEFLEMNALELLTEDSQRLFLERQRKVAAGEEIPPYVEFQIKTKSGHKLWVLLTSKLFEEKGQAVRAAAVVYDITDQKRAEEALKASEYMFQAAFRFSPDWVSISTLDEGLYLDVNEAYCRGTGWAREEVLGKTSQEIGLWANLEDRIRGARIIDRDGHLQRMEVTFRRKTGQEIIALWSAARVSIGGRDCLVSVVHDVTERKQAEESLKASEKRFRDLFESITDLVYTQDLEGRFTSVNPALADLFGYQTEDLIGHRAAEFMKPKHQEAFETEYLAALKTTGRHEGTSLYFSALGERLYIEYRSHLVSPEGAKSYISGIGLDVTERVKAQKQLESLQHQLLQAQKMEAIGTLASGIAHDFNNILHAVSGYLELLTSGRRDVPSDHRYLGEINLLIERAAELVRRLLTFSRKVESRLEPVDLNREVIQTIKMLERTIPKMIRIETDLAEDLPPVHGDRTQIEQIIMNLGGNAKDAMPQGGLLTVQTRAVVLDEAYSRSQVDVAPGQYVRLRVSDTGHGMDPETVQHIFEPFFTTKEIGHGTGLGLSTVYGIVKAHGGHLTCVSGPDQGTTFDVFLPALTGVASQDTARAEDEDQAAGGDETILLVDDDPAILDIARDILQRHGYTALLAASGEEALAIHAERGAEIDLVVLDLNMPGMGGQACLEALVARDPEVKVLVASGYQAGGTEETVIEAGALGFVAKPFRLKDLLRRVRETLTD